MIRDSYLMPVWLTHRIIETIVYKTRVKRAVHNG